MSNFYSFNFNANGIMNHTTGSATNPQVTTPTANNNNNDVTNSTATNLNINMWEPNNASTNAINNNNNLIENDDFDSDQLDEDDSYSWASGLTDNQDGLGQNTTNTLIGCGGAGTNATGCSSSSANWRDWRSNTISSDMLINLGSIARANANFGINYTSLTSQQTNAYLVKQSSANNQIASLVDLCSKFVAENLPFELVESFRQPVPEDLQLKITYSSFPDNIENIRLYSCLANGCVDEYLRGEQLYQNKCVRKIMQIGFHLSAQVLISSSLGINTANNNNSSLNQTLTNNATSSNTNSSHMFLNNTNSNYRSNANSNSSSNLFASVAIVCDRKKIISCHCTCSKQTVPWCSHVVAVCLYRILDANSVEYRAPVSESLSKLHRDQLQKFAQYLISELPQQILPTAQRLLDELLKGDESSMNLLSGAPDPTAGASQTDISVWCLDELILQENIRKTLLKFIVPTPNVVSDIECLEHASSATAAEYTSLLRPLRGREPEGMWNLVSIVREMFKRRDKNSIPLLKLITQECVNLDQILQLWFLVKASQLNHEKVLFNTVSLHGSTNQRNNNNLTHTPPMYQACASLMDEIVTLWRIACLNPLVVGVDDEKLKFREYIIKWHQTTLEKLRKFCNNIVSNNNNPNVWSSQTTNTNNGEKLLKRLDMDQFSGFMPAINASKITWNDFDFESPSVFKQQCLTKLELMIQSINLQSHEIKQQENEPSSLLINNSTNKTQSDLNLEEQDLLSLYSFEYDPAKLKQQSKLDDKSNLINSKLKMANLSLSHDENNLDVLFSRCEALYLHGYDEQACILAELLAEHLVNATATVCSLFNPVEKPTESDDTTKNNKSKTSKKYVTNFNETIIWRSFLLCNILHESSLRVPPVSSLHSTKMINRKKKQLNNLAFRIGLFGLETPRAPANSKALEVKLLNQETDLVNLLKRLKVGSYEMSLLTERATRLKDYATVYNQTQRSSHPTVYQCLPLTLASFIFDIFSSSGHSTSQDMVKNEINDETNENESSQSMKSTDLQQLGFEAAVAVLGMRANVNESQHSLLCEGIRRQKGDLALTLLLAYKDDEQRLLRIMDKILDKDTYVLFKPSSSVILNPFNPNFKKIQQQQLQEFAELGLNQPAAMSSDSDDTSSRPQEALLANELSQFQIKLLSSQPKSNSSLGFKATATAIDSLSSGWEESENESPNLSNDVSLLETKYRCMNLRQLQPQQTTSLVQSSQTVKDTTSSDNSPTSNRKQTHSTSTLTSSKLVKESSSDKNKNLTSIDDSGDDSGESSSSSQDNSKPKNESDLKCDSLFNQTESSSAKTSRSSASLRQPNQPSEALAHFMFEFSKTVLSKAGGSISTSVFLNQQNTQPGGGPHRNLHICSFLISLYALGLHNCVQPTWLTRTYSSHVTWINSQASDIGYAAICILIECWQGRLTPSECVSLADRVSRGRDNMTVRAAAELALSSLRFANFMNLNEIQRALIQCKEQSADMLQRACIIVENSVRDANSTNLLEILFTVAKRWDELFIESLRSSSAAANSVHSNQVSSTISAAANPDLPLTSGNVAETTFNPNILNQNLLNLMNQNQTGSNFTLDNLNTMIQQVQQIQSNTNSTNSCSNVSNQSQIPFYPVYSQHIPPQPQFGMFNNQPTQSSASLYTPYTNASQNFSQQPPQLNNPNFASYFNTHHNSNYQFNNQQMSFQQQQQINYQQNYIRQQQQQQQQHQSQPLNLSSLNVESIDETAMRHLTSAFRVGMLGLEALPRRSEGQVKYRQSPLYADDVKWLWEVSVKLDSYLKSTNSLQQFCQTAATAIQNPFLLQDIAFDSAQYLARNNPTQFSMVLCSPMLNIIVQRCMSLYYRCFTTKLHHITANEHEDFISMIITARNLFYYSGNMNCFSDLIQTLRRSKGCKKDFFGKICNALNNTNCSF